MNIHFPFVDLVNLLPNVPNDQLPQKCILNMAIERGPYIDQSQSLNLFVNPPQPKIIHSIHMYGKYRNMNKLIIINHFSVKILNPCQVDGA